ncbi:MAG: RES domain-containing protein [Marinisporobacter sp.]|jgi:hypothetical protein|nr:RES domain-containing protein [Marinisporobacter sp.]
MFCDKIFESSYIKRIVQDEGVISKCKCCGENNIKCIDEKKLYQILEQIIDLFEPDEDLRDHVRCEIIDEIEDEFDVDFSEIELEIEDKLEELVERRLNTFECTLSHNINRFFKVFSNRISEEMQNEVLNSVLEHSKYYNKYLASEAWIFKFDNSGEITMGLNEIKNTIRYDNRFCINISQLFDKHYPWKLEEVLTDHAEIIHSDKKFFRARLGCEMTEDEFYSEKIAYDRENIGKPPKQKAKNNRLSPVGIAYLYLSNCINTSISEVRPFLGQLVSIGEFKLCKQIKIINFSKNNIKIDIQKDMDIESEIKKIIVYKYLQNEFSKPFDPQKVDLEYVTLQILGEFIKNLGYDGIMYKSAMGEGGNLLVFNDKHVKCIGTELVKVNNIQHDHKKYDSFSDSEIFNEVFPLFS